MMGTLVGCLVLAVLCSWVSALKFSNPFAEFLQGLKIGNSGVQPTTRTVAVSGSSGLIGSELLKSLSRREWTVIPINSRVEIDDETLQKLEGIHAMIHLAGENVASGDGPLAILGRWDGVKKDKILNSRVGGTAVVVEAISKLKSKPKVFVSASAVGLYGYKDGTTAFDEASVVAGEGFDFIIVHFSSFMAFRSRFPCICVSSLGGRGAKSKSTRCTNGVLTLLSGVVSQGWNPCQVSAPFHPCPRRSDWEWEASLQLGHAGRCSEGNRVCH